MPATVWLKRHVCVEQTVWAPGQKEVIQNKLLTEDGFIDRPGCAAFNIYEPPTIELGDPKKAMEWLALVRAVFPDEKDTYEFISFGAHAVQRPWEKVNHALVMASRKQGIGKDTLLEPIRYGVGLKNFVEVSPKQLMGRFNGFARSVVLRVSEAKDLGETNRFEFYDHTKVYAAAPPNVHRVDEKNTKEYSVLNCCHLIITTNYLTGGLYLPPEDRRHYVAESPRSPEDFEKGYFDKMWEWYAAGGCADVVAYLRIFPIGKLGFNPKAQPVKTKAFWKIAHGHVEQADAQFADVLDLLGECDADGKAIKWPDVVTVQQIKEQADFGFGEWLNNSRNFARIPHKMETCGYIKLSNPADKRHGFWTVNKKRTVVYAKDTLSLDEQMAAAQKLTEKEKENGGA
jgi:hypothetical protein